MIDIDKTLKAVDKLKRIKPDSELEKAVIDNIINSHMIAICQSKLTESNNKIMSYDTVEYYATLDCLEQKLGKI